METSIILIIKIKQFKLKYNFLKKIYKIYKYNSKN